MIELRELYPSEKEGGKKPFGAMNAGVARIVTGTCLARKRRP
jgi:hypothetical protein